MNTISILGCGWLGLPLAEYLLEKGYRVKGSTATYEKLAILKSKKIEPCYINLSPGINADYDPDFFNCDVLIVNFPPKRIDDIVSYHIKQIESLINKLKNTEAGYVLFISSTSVYPEVNREVTEDNMIEPSK